MWYRQKEKNRENKVQKTAKDMRYENKIGRSTRCRQLYVNKFNQVISDRTHICTVYTIQYTYDSNSICTCYIRPVCIIYLYECISMYIMYIWSYVWKLSLICSLRARLVPKHTNRRKVAYQICNSMTWLCLFVWKIGERLFKRRGLYGEVYIEYLRM